MNQEQRMLDLIKQRKEKTGSAYSKGSSKPVPKNSKGFKSTKRMGRSAK